MFDDDGSSMSCSELDDPARPDSQVSYRAELFGYPYEIGPESVDAIYLPESSRARLRGGRI